MKRIILLFAFYFSVSCLFAQNTITQYLFPQFSEGTVMKKSGEIVKALMNYNTLTQEMIFKQNEQFLALDQVETVDTVYILNSAFIPVNNMFYEVAVKAPVGLYVQYQTIIIPPGNETGFGQSQTTAITNISDLKNSGKAYALKLPDEYKLRSETGFFLKQGDKFINIRNAKDVKNVFSSKADAINTYLKSNKINFKNKDDVAKLVEFCNNG